MLEALLDALLDTGKGVRYSTEVIHLKAGKTGGKK